jgi:pyruvate/2-oxoglutarate dehydrogenase complex dihydrolipoamide dehydrogenase (E3) component
MPGKNVVILGSGDIGLIMARRMTLEGANVKAVCEIMPYSGGLTRNIVQCLDDFGIPLKLSHTVLKIHGNERVTGVTIAKVDENKNAIAGTEEYIECDTVLYSVGLIPENELTKGAGIAMDRITGGAIVDQNRQTKTEGIFSCGNVLHVHDLVDFVSEEAEIAGKGAAKFIKNRRKSKAENCAHINVTQGEGIRYTVPSIITEKCDTSVFFRVSDVYKNAVVTVKDGDKTIYSKKKLHLAPGEMERVELKKEMLEKLESGTLTFSLDLNA